MIRPLILWSIASVALADGYIEEVRVIGQQRSVTTSDLSVSINPVEAVMPTQAFTQGGYGGFSGFSERGTQSAHTTVYRNGVPVNDASSGWYDFAHNTADGQMTYSADTGPSSVLYGSGSLGGTVFMNDTITPGLSMRLGEEHTLVNIATERYSITHFNVNNGSIKTDNTENDWYTNTTLVSTYTLDDFEWYSRYQQYDYDYDSCYTDSFLLSDDCEQTGTNADISLRNDNFTFGYSRNNTNFFTGTTETWSALSERYFADARKSVTLFGMNGIYGTSYQKEVYDNNDQELFSGYALIDIDKNKQVGIRVTPDSVVYNIATTFDDFTVSYATAYRNPTLYAINGDSFVTSNFNLDPEESQGLELQYKFISLFKYNFKQGIDYDFTNNMYVNTGEYQTQGVRANTAFSYSSINFDTFIGYTDTDVPRVPKWKSAVTAQTELFGYTFQTKFVLQLDKGVDYTQQRIDDLRTLDFAISKKVDNWLLSFVIQDALDREFEFVPGYHAGGRRFFLTFKLN